MNSLSNLIKHCTVFALATGLSSHVVFAEDVVPPNAQSDEQISVWANNLPLERFVSELAYITGRDASIEGDLEGSVTGQFNGSMFETLGMLGKQYAVLFDLQETTLRVVSESELSSETFTISSSQLSDELRQTLSNNVLPGNSIEIGVAEVMASGHPSFVKRVGQSVFHKVEDEGNEPSIIGATPIEESVLAASSLEGQVPSEEPSVMLQDTEIVIDTAASQLLESELTTSGTDSEAASASDVSKPILWVTDIPGYNTF